MDNKNIIFDTGEPNFSYNTVVTDEDLNDCFVDESGVLYSKDGKRLLRGSNVAKYTVRKGTVVICENAFNEREKTNYERIWDKDHNGEYVKFFDGDRIEEIVISASVKVIGNYAFYGCESLKRVSFGNSLCIIGASAFYGCESLTQIVIPDSVISIGEKAFADCSSLFKIKLPKYLSIIQNETFYRCKNLKKVVFPASLTEIGYNAFGGCTSFFLKTPNTVNRIKGDIGCAFEIDKNPQHFIMEDGVLYNHEKDTIFAFLCYYNKDGRFKGNMPKWTIKKSTKMQYETGGYYDDIDWPIVAEKWIDVIDIIIPNTIRCIGDFAFYNKGYIRTLTIPESVKSIGENAFCNNEGLEKVILPDSLMDYDLYKYFNDKSINIVIPIEVAEKIKNANLIRCSVHYDFEKWLKSHSELFCVSKDEIEECIHSIKKVEGNVLLNKVKDFISNLIQYRIETIDELESELALSNVKKCNNGWNGISKLSIELDKEKIDDILYILKDRLKFLMDLKIHIENLEDNV